MTLAGAEAVDWEDIAIRGRTLYVGDIGDNLAVAAGSPSTASPSAGRGDTRAPIVLRYPDGPHDAEALLVDPRWAR